MYKELNKDAKKCMKLSSIIGTVITLVVLLIIYCVINKFGFEEYINYFYIIGGIIMLIEVLDLFLLTSIRYKRYKYLISEDKIEVIEGLFWTTTSIVPIERLHQVVLKEGPLDKKYNLVNLVIITAGGEVEISFLKKEEGLKIAELLKEKINVVARGSVCEG